MDRRARTAKPVNGAGIGEGDSEINARENCLASYVRTVQNIKMWERNSESHTYDSLEICLLRGARYELKLPRTSRDISCLFEIEIGKSLLFSFSHERR